MKHVHLCLMAAGASVRFGGRKQLALMHDVPMLIKQLRLMNEVQLTLKLQGIELHVQCIFGAYADEIIACLATHQTSVQYCINPQWQLGIGENIAFGCKQLLLKSKPDAIAICLLDQVALTVDDMVQLITQHFDHKHAQTTEITSAEYANILGVPAVFSPACFHALCQLNGDAGARKIIGSANFSVQSIPLNNAVIDIDTKAQLSAFLKA